MLTLKKDGGVKVLDPNSSLLPVLKNQGWVVEGEIVRDFVDQDLPKPRGPKPKGK